MGYSNLVLYYWSTSTNSLGVFPAQKNTPFGQRSSFHICAFINPATFRIVSQIYIYYITKINYSKQH